MGCIRVGQGFCYCSRGTLSLARQRGMPRQGTFEMTTTIAPLTNTDGGSAPMPRRLFDYEVIEFLGKGAGTIIYAVAHSDTKQIYAMKHVVKRKEKDIRFIEQVQVEFETSRNFTHPNLRRAFEVKDNAALLRKATEVALVMELFDGVSLAARRPENPLKTVGYFIQVARGLAAMHAIGFVHCDLKPNNILVSAEGDVKIIDFGQACKVGSEKERIQGTPDFIAPEQVKCAPMTVKTDVFNFGATMYWTLTGRNIPTLYTVSKTNAENSFLVDDRIPTPAELNQHIAEPLSNLVMECIRTAPSKRPADVQELIRRLEVVEHAVARRSAVV
jgi:serine/threonine-protein kinase